MQGRQWTRPRKPRRLILFPGCVKLDQAVSMLPDAQHSAWLTSVLSTRLQVASRPCWSQQTPPADKRASSHVARGALRCPSPHPGLGLPASCRPMAMHTLVLSNYGGDDLPLTWEGGAENRTGVPTLAADSLGTLPLWAPAPTLLQHPPHPPPGNLSPLGPGPQPGPGILPEQANARSWTCQGQQALEPPLPPLPSV